MWEKTEKKCRLERKFNLKKNNGKISVKFLSNWKEKKKTLNYTLKTK